MRALTKRPLLLVLAVLILLDILAVQTVLSRDKSDSSPPPAASSTRTPPGVRPVTVSPPSVVPGDVASPKATPPVEPPDTPTPTPEATPSPEVTPTPEATPTPKATPTPEPTPTPTPKPSPTPKATPSDEDPPDSTPTEPQIDINGASFAGRPFETVRMDGTYSGSRARTILRVQHREDGSWVEFPLPTITDESGNFTVYVELGSIGEHQVRVVDPRADVVSETVLVVIR